MTDTKPQPRRQGMEESIHGLVRLTAAFLKPWSQAGDEVLAATKKPDDLPQVMWEDARAAIRMHRDQNPKPTGRRNGGFAR